jgi:molecular chaperone GrpE
VSHDKKNSTAALHEQLKENVNEDEALLEHPSYIELQKKLDEAEEKANQNWDRSLRIQAEMDNTQRRAERDVSNAHKYALEKFSLELLPVVDNLERSLLTSEEEHSVNAVLEGIKLTLKMFHAALEKFGVEQVNPEGQVFNPDLHQAVSVQVDPKIKPNTVINVLQKGYLLNNRLIRPALVVVSKAEA